MQFFCVPYEGTLQTFGNCLNPTQSIDKHLQGKKSLLYGTNNIVWVQDFPLCNTYYFEGQVSGQYNILLDLRQMQLVISKQQYPCEGNKILQQSINVTTGIPAFSI